LHISAHHHKLHVSPRVPLQRLSKIHANHRDQSIRQHRQAGIQMTAMLVVLPLKGSGLKGSASIIHIQQIGMRSPEQLSTTSLSVGVTELCFGPHTIHTEDLVREKGPRSRVDLIAQAVGSPFKAVGSPILHLHFIIVFAFFSRYERPSWSRP